ncbi:hypothetical protein XU18_2008 [Perkinsela sp. CCAP 1560/4]|nr:hypothetical protein XU18_2008 [Perkinsela sp. CCAP 1560/4]|eukprot:KNH07476.1 hypothetical protein XU18_2008 [Perkinsela sp. CCAP 1560/4]
MSRISMQSSKQKRDDPRFISLEYILDLLSTYHGRRQYKMRLDLKVFLEKFRQASLDWHDLKGLSNEDFLLLSESLRFSAGERTMLAYALHSKLCGVMLSKKSSKTGGICRRRGKSQFGWSCGEECHLNRAYLEDEQNNEENVSAKLLNASSMSKYRCVENGMVVETRPMPNFEIVGRRNEDITPRAWRESQDPRFVVKFMGYDFRVHPDDARYGVQVKEKEELWKAHAEKLRLVLLEMIETYATDKGLPQPLELKTGDINPDASFAMSFAPDPDGTIVEYRVIDRLGRKKPWFITPEPQTFVNGIPTNLPLAPSVIVKINIADGHIGGTNYSTNIDDPQRMQLQVSLMFHHKACFFWAGRNEENALGFLTDYARKIPYSLPLYLYYRVDSAATIHNNPDARDYVARVISSPKNGLLYGSSQ